MVTFNLRHTFTIGRFDPNLAPSFIRFGTVADRQISVRPPVNLKDVREIENAFNENPELSTRNAERELRIHRSSIRDVLRKKVKMFPYKVSFLQELLSRDYAGRIN